MTFKVGDRVRVLGDTWLKQATGSQATVCKAVNIHSIGIKFDVPVSPYEVAYFAAGQLELISPTVEEKVMRIANYDVVVVDNNAVKIGCQQVTKADVERVLAAMDGWDGGMIPLTDLPFYKLGVVPDKDAYYGGALFVRTPDEIVFVHNGEGRNGGCDSRYSLGVERIRVRPCHWDGEKLTVPVAVEPKLTIGRSVIIRVDNKDRVTVNAEGSLFDLTRTELNALLKLMSEWCSVPTLKVGDYVRVINAFDYDGPKKGREMPTYKNLIGKFGKIIRISVNIAEVEFTERIDIDEDVAGVAKGHGRSFFLHQLERID